MYGSRRSDTSDKISATPITRPTGKPLVAYTESVKVRYNGCVYLASTLFLKTRDVCAVRCSIHALGHSHDTPEG